MTSDVNPASLDHEIAVRTAQGLRRKAALERIRRTASETGVWPFEGVPRFFRECCAEARRGGRSGYSQLGYQVAIRIDEHAADDYEDESAWPKRQDILVAALDARDETAIWRWFREEYPRCMKLVPLRRKSRFVDGVLEAYREGDIPFWD